MTASSAYGAFAYAYDKALGERFFRAARQLLNQLMEQYPAEEKTHLDVACGTGLAAHYFASRGWTSTGVDASLPMLRVARTRIGRAIACDFRALAVRGTFSRITCLYDSLNHLKKRSDLVEAFRSIAGVMDSHSLFFFDVNHPDIYPEIWGMKEPFFAEGPDYELEIATTFRRRDGIGHALVTGWAVVNGVREHISEHHEQRAWSERDIVATLGEARLEVVEVINFDPFNEADVIEAAAVKLFFVCRRRE